MWRRERAQYHVELTWLLIDWDVMVEAMDVGCAWSLDLNNADDPIVVGAPKLLLHLWPSVCNIVVVVAKAHDSVTKHPRGR